MTGRPVDRDAEVTALASSLQAIGQALRRQALAEVQRLAVPLTPAQLLALRTLVRHARAVPQRPAMALSVLAEGMGLSHSTVSGVVDRLVRSGLVTRTVRAGDRRYSDIQLAPAAARWVDEELPGRWAQPLAGVAAAATDDEWLAILRGIRLLEGLLSSDREAQERLDVLPMV